MSEPIETCLTSLVSLARAALNSGSFQQCKCVQMYSVMLFQKRTKFCVLIGVLIFGGLSLAHAQAPTPLPIPSLENTDSSDPSGEQDLERKCASGDMKACHTLLAFVEQGCNRNDARA